jgi:hypothetical protein
VISLPNIYGAHRAITHRTWHQERKTEIYDKNCISVTKRLYNTEENEPDL